MVAPIANRVRGHGFEVKLAQIKTQGVVLCQKVKTIDYEYHGIEFIETASAKVLNEVLAKVRVLVN